jgi:glycine oxidase
MRHPDLCIAGAGIIGLSLALELHNCGYKVSIFDQGAPLRESSTAAAGMLAIHDPDNSPKLLPLSTLSLSLYPGLLEQIRVLSGIHVPFQTHMTLQSVSGHGSLTDSEPSREDRTHLPSALVPGDHRFIRLDENSLDPRQLAPALLAAVRATTIDLRAHTPVLSSRSIEDAVEVAIPSGTVHTSKFVNCTGAWASVTSNLSDLHIKPRKGQMLSISLPPSLPLDFVVRTPEIYIVPRTTGPAAGRAIIGATVEDSGFDRTVNQADIDRLHALASALLPAITTARQLESWSGLRPATSDGLPSLGAITGRQNHFVAAGHYRNGILLAPASARVMAQLIVGEAASIDLTSFSPERFASQFPGA